VTLAACVGNLEFRGLRVRPHPSMNGKKAIVRHGGEWWVSYLVYSLLQTEYIAMIKSLTVVESK
jgi:hypothetical protein